MSNSITYDSECNFCQGVVKFLKKRDKKGHFRFVPLQSDEGKKLMEKAGLSENDKSTVVYHTSNKIFIRSTAVLHILKVMRQLGATEQTANK